MASKLTRLWLLGGLTAAAAVSAAQSANCLPPPLWGWYGCIDPESQQPYSNDYTVYNISPYIFSASPFGCDDAPLFNITVGMTGTANYAAGCPFENGYGVTVAGGFAFNSGPIGSIHTSLDDALMLVFGAPFEPGNAGGLATIVTGDDVQTRWGTEGFNMRFRGISDRYMIVEGSAGGVLARLNVDVIGDAARLEWTLTNTGDGSQPIGLWFGNWIAMLNQEGEIKGFYGAGPSDYVFIHVDKNRPPTRETRWIRSGNSSIFPEYVNFNWSQEEPYGLRVDNGPTDGTKDPRTGESDATQADEFVIGFQGTDVDGPGLLPEANEFGVFSDATFPMVDIQPGKLQSDLEYRSNPGYIQKFYPKPVNPGASRKIIQYFRTTWGQSDYTKPYAIVVDAPRLVNYSPNGVNGLAPNPFNIRVYIDNIRGFTSAEKEFTLEGVRVTLDLRNTPGVKLTDGTKIGTKLIQKIDPRRFRFVDFPVEVDGIATGVLPFKVHVEAPPGPTKDFTGKLEVSTTPRLPLVFGANLVTVPWQFDDTSWASVLGLSQPSQFQAFVWDPNQQGYVLSTRVERGRSAWLVIRDTSVTGTPLQLAANPDLPEDAATGAPVVQLVQGWNMIGNPYQYPIQLGDILGVPASSPEKSYTWDEMVGAGFISGALSYWDASSASPGYRFISGVDALMEPNRGYWIYVFDTGVTLKYPPVFKEGAITGGNTLLATALGARTRAASEFAQTEKQWRLQIVARNGQEVDDQNFVGVASTAKDAKMLTMYEPPMAPEQNLGVSIAPSQPGGTRLAQAMSDRTGRQEWTVLVEAKEAGSVTVTWPNLRSVPRNIRFRMVDPATGVSRDMRQSSGYTFTAEANTTREIKVQAEPGVASRAVIGNVVVTRPSRSRTAPFTISYTLSADALTTVRILGTGGKEVFTATRGRADRVGENTVTWTMRDNAGRAVAPGTYRVEIIAETSTGERVRKIVPVNVVR